MACNNILHETSIGLGNETAKSTYNTSRFTGVPTEAGNVSRNPQSEAASVVLQMSYAETL